MKSYVAMKWEEYRKTVPVFSPQATEEIRNAFYCGMMLYFVVMDEARKDGLSPSVAMHAINVECGKYMAELHSTAGQTFPKDDTRELSSDEEERVRETARVLHEKVSGAGK